MAERVLRKINDALSAVFLAVSVLLLMVIVVIIFANVVARDLLSTSLPSTGETSVFSLMWLTFLGAAVGYRKRMFPAFTALVDRLTGRVATAVRLFALAANTLAAAILIVVGTQFSLSSLAQRSPVWGVSLGLMYLAIPVSGVAIALMSLEFAIDVVRDDVDRGSLGRQESEGQNQ